MTIPEYKKEYRNKRDIYESVRILGNKIEHNESSKGKKIQDL